MLIHFEASEASVVIIEKVRKEKGFKTNRQALDHIILSYPSEETIEKYADAVVQAMDKKFISKERLRWSLLTAEQNSIVILDVLNTILLRDQVTRCTPVDVMASPVIKTSQERLKEKIAHFKQMADDRRSKQRKNEMHQDS